MCEVVWNGFLLGAAGREVVPCRCGGTFDGDGHLFWECLFTPFWFPFERALSSAELSDVHETSWLRCSKWHGCLLALSAPRPVPLGRVVTNKLLVIRWSLLLVLTLQTSLNIGIQTLILILRIWRHACLRIRPPGLTVVLTETGSPRFVLPSEEPLPPFPATHLTSFDGLVEFNNLVENSSGPLVSVPRVLQPLRRAEFWR